MRKPALILGLLLMVAGGFVLADVVRFTERKEVLRIGDAALSVSQEKGASDTLGYGLLAAGALGLVIAALAKR